MATRTLPRTTPDTRTAPEPAPQRRYHPDWHCPAQKERTVRTVRRIVTGQAMPKVETLEGWLERVTLSRPVSWSMGRP